MIISSKEISSVTTKVQVNATELDTRVYSFDTIVVGSGAAGLNAVDLLAARGNNVALVTEGLKMGTSRNTGSDKQTYYKLTLSDSSPDSVEDMARSFFDGGAVDGDIALCEAAGSTRSFMRLVDLGVPFPYNDYGEFVGYQTDHDTRTRATSCGPLTSKYMTEALEKAVLSRGTPIFDGYRVIKLFNKNGKAVGVAALSDDETSNKYGLCIFKADNIIWACGGPSAIYSATVYPESQTCAHGVLFEAGASAVNVTESQYGAASVKFRWNLSGTYQQVIPRYYSVDEDGNEIEFPDNMFESPTQMFTAIFRKGYQWPFDPAKLNRSTGNISSFVDIAVFKERMAGRKVYMDFRKNPSAAGDEFDFSLLDAEPLTYLKNSNALLGTPIKRLEKMNPQAIELYKSHGIDLYTEPLEIDICAQHNNGGFEVDTNYESVSIKGLYVVGEAAGVFGVHRPGGSALNSTQVSSRRAAEAVMLKKVCGGDSCCSSTHAGCGVGNSKLGESAACSGGDSCGAAAHVGCDLCEPCDITTHVDFELNLPELGDMTIFEVLKKREVYAKRMSRVGGFIRDREQIIRAVGEIKAELEEFKKYSPQKNALTALMINRDILLTQYIYLLSIVEYIDDGGKSRGSYLISDKLPDGENIEIDSKHFSKICSVTYDDGCNGEFDGKHIDEYSNKCNGEHNGEHNGKGSGEYGGKYIGECRFSWRDVRKIPTRNNWFENILAEYRAKFR